jgi:predicted RNase H-like HicB family nuclease
MLTEYINAALKLAQYEVLEDHTIYAEIPGLDGVYANANTVDECRNELGLVLEDWIVLGLRMGHRLPAIGGVTLDFHREPV